MKTKKLFLRAILVVLFSCFTYSSSFALGCAPLPVGITSWWSAEGNAQDVKGLNNGTLQNSAGFTQGIVGQGFNFNDAYSARVSVPNSASLNVGTGDFSMEAWVKSNAAKDIANIVDKRGAGYVGYSWFLNHLGYSGFQMTTANGKTLTIGSTVFIPDGKFHHLAVTVKRDSKTGLKFFVDGLLVNTYDPTGVQGSLDNSADFLIGGHLFDSWRTFDGVIDELSLYKRTLADYEIAAIFNAGSAGKCSQGNVYDITTQSTFNLDFATNYDAKNAQTVELKNTSANPIAVSNVIISNASSYWVNLFADSKLTCRAKYYLPYRKNFTIPANSSCNISVGFSPFNNVTAGTPIAATMTLKTTINGIATDKVINLTGIGRKQVPNFYNRTLKSQGLDTWAVSELKGGNIPINTSLVGAASGYDSAKFWYGSLLDPSLKKVIASVGNLVVFAENNENPSGHVGVVIQKTPVLTMLSMNDIRDSKGVKVRRWSVRPVDWYGKTATWSPLIIGFNATNAAKHYGFIDWRSDLY